MNGKSCSLFNEQDGFSLVMALWLMALLGIAGSMFAYQSIQQSRMTDAVIQRENAHSLARAGVELWMSRLNQDPTTYDAFTDNWGWGGQLKDGTNMGDTVYVPSGNKDFTEGDIGYFRIERIEDESGKHNVKDPLNAGTNELLAARALDGDSDPDEAPGLRTLSQRQSENMADKSTVPTDTGWISPGDMMYVSYLGESKFEEYKHIGSIYRTDGTINVNTAPYETLLGVQMRSLSDTNPKNCEEDPCVYFLDDEIAREIIMQTRSGASLSEPSNSEEAAALYDQERTSYRNGSGNPFETKDEVVNAIQSAGPEKIEDFQDTAFKDNIRIDSEGVFRVLVRGVSMDAKNDPVNAVTLEAYVDRSQDPMEIISLRAP
jgi:Tfp pilus assembly protein PilX